MTPPLTETELAAIQARADAATPGPWTEDDGNVFSRPLSDQRHATIMRRLDGSDEPHPDDGREHPLGFVATTTQNQPNFEADAKFIRHARTDVPRLVEAVRALVKPYAIAELAATHWKQEADRLRELLIAVTAPNPRLTDEQRRQLEDEVKRATGGGT